jgi:DNA recombination protein RmuC
VTLTASEWILFAAGAGLGLAVGLGIALVAVVKLRAAAAAIDAERRIEQERDRAMTLATERLAHTFDQLANEQFRSHSETFLQLAREHLGGHHEKAKGELAAREQAIESLLRPIRETLARTESQLHELDKSRRETHGSITAQLAAMAMSHQALSAETRNLVKALRRPEVRGQWGEITLKRLVELAGMVEHCDFVTQSHTVTESGTVRPDMIVNLPEGRRLVVDVKTPLDAYLEATEAESDAARGAAMARHAAIVAGRVRELAGKAYWAQFEASPEFVILFIPGDQFLSAALAERPGLLDEALRQNIILATPTSLVALLKAIAYGWQQVALADNATAIRSIAVELYERLGTFTRHIANVGKALGDSVKAYNSSVGSLERMVLPSARKFTELGVKPRKELAPLVEIEESARAPADDTVESEGSAESGPALRSGPH